MTEEVVSFEDIMADPVFTPKLREQIASVQQFQVHTEQFVDDLINGAYNQAVLQGPPGLGKSYSVTQALKRSGKVEGRDYIVIKGHVTPTELFLTLYMFRRPDQIVVMDDCDDIFIKDTGLEVLKAACDDDYRRVTWLSSQAPVVNGTVLTQFTFNGKLIVCTNMSMTTGRGGRRDRAAAAFLSRLACWDLRLDTRERAFAQMFNMVVNADYLSRSPKTAISMTQKRDLLKFILEHLDDIKCLDLRMPQAIARTMVSRPDDWQFTARHLITHGVQ